MSYNYASRHCVLTPTGGGKGMFPIVTNNVAESICYHETIGSNIPAHHIDAHLATQSSEQCGRRELNAQPRNVPDAQQDVSTSREKEAIEARNCLKAKCLWQWHSDTYKT